MYRLRSADLTARELVALSARSKQRLTGNDNSCKNWNAAIEQHDLRREWQIPTKKEKASKNMKWKKPDIDYDSDFGRGCFHRRRRGRFHREHHGQPRHLQPEYAVLPGWLRTANQLEKECRSRQLQLKFAMLPDWLRTANQLAWLQMIAFSPIFLTRALCFAERLTRTRSKCSLTHQFSTVESGLGLKTEVGSTVQLHWSNAAQKNPKKSRLWWNQNHIFNLASFGHLSQAAQKNSNKSHLETASFNRHRGDSDLMRKFEYLLNNLQPHKRYPGSRLCNLERKIREVKYYSSVISTNLAIKVRTPVLWRPPKGCQSPSWISLLADALARNTHQVGSDAKAIRSMSSHILRRVFNVLRRLEMFAKVSHIHRLHHNLSTFAHARARNPTCPSCFIRNLAGPTSATTFPHPGKVRSSWTKSWTASS